MLVSTVILLPGYRAEACHEQETASCKAEALHRSHESSKTVSELLSKPMLHEATGISVVIFTLLLLFIVFLHCGPYLRFYRSLNRKKLKQ